MTQEIKREDHPDFVGGWIWSKLEICWIKERIAEAVLHEREACAKVLEAISNAPDMQAYAKAIRARGEQA